MTRVAPGFVLLAHRDLDRAGDLAAALAGAGHPVAVHVDAAAPKAARRALAARLDRLPRIVPVPSRRCPWGSFGLVAASCDAAGRLLAAAPGISHVTLLSGACLPVRPLSAFCAALDEDPEADWIEAVPIRTRRWVQDGLEIERFTMRHPFDYRRQRRLFEWNVALHRRLGLVRRLPEGLEPRLGAQWWCLTARSLRALLEDPRRSAFDRFFARVWIPDESYFQTLIPRYARRLTGAGPTLARFDPLGRPFQFEDDHADLLAASGHYFARKIAPWADGLYRRFLDPGLADTPPAPERITAAMDRAAEIRTRGRPGRLSQGRYPVGRREWPPVAARDYWVFIGFDAAFPDIAAWAAAGAPGTVAHGRLFHPDGAQFAGGGPTGPGALPAAAAIRDYHRQQFLLNLLWADRDRRQAFLFRPAEAEHLAWDMIQDPAARLLVLTGGWVAGLLADGIAPDDPGLADRAAVAARAERRFLNRLRSRHARALRIAWPLIPSLSRPEALARGLERALGLRGGGPCPAPAVTAAEIATLGARLRGLGLDLRGVDAPTRPPLHPIPTEDPWPRRSASS